MLLKDNIQRSVMIVGTTPLDGQKSVTIKKINSILMLFFLKSNALMGIINYDFP